MKNRSNSGSTNTVVAATTSSSSSSSTTSSSSLGITASVTSAQQPSGSLSVENRELPRSWQNSAVVRDLHSSSDTDDCDLDIGIGRLVIDLEADLDSKACRSKIEMKSSGAVQKSTSSSVPGSATISNTTPLNSSSIQTAGINSNDSNTLLSRATKGASVATDNAKSSHRSLVKNAQSNSNFIPVSAAQGDLVDRGIKMRIKCSQSTHGSSSSVLTSKHEIMQFHSPFLTSSLDNAVTLSGSASNIAANKTTSNQTSQGSSSLGKYNCNRSSHKKDRHVTKDRNKVTGAGRPFVDDLGCSSANRSPSSHSNCATVASKEATDIALKSDASNDGGLPKILTLSADPYEFNMKTEDTIGLPVKKIKLDRCDASNSPIVELCLPCVEKKDVAVDASHIGTITEPECLGPCEPGTSVTLEGIVWNETENGLLVVNVTWRGKTYVGTLMDSTRHHWAPPRFSGDSPTSDLEARTPKGRGKRGRACAVVQRNEGNGSDRKLRSNRFGKPATIAAAPSPVRNDGNSQKRSRPETSSSDGSRGSKCSRSDSRTSDSGNGSANAVGELIGSGMIECPEENCSKKYRNLNGLRYHQTRAHKLSCASLARETSDLDVGKYITDDLSETSTAVDKMSQKGKNLTPESSNYVARKPSYLHNKLADVHCKTEEPLEGMDLEAKLNGDGTVVKGEDVRETDAISEKTSLGVSTKLDTSFKSLSVAIVEESFEQNRSKESNSFPVMNIDDPRILEIAHQPLLSLTPVPLDSNSNGAVFEIPSNGSRKQCVVSVGQPNDSFQSQSSNVDESTLSDITKDRDRAKKLKPEKVDRGKLKTSSDSLLRPVISNAAVPSTTAASTKPEILSPLLVSSSVSSQLKQNQTKPTLPCNHANLAVFSDKGKKRKRDKEKPKEQSAASAGKLTSVAKSVAGSESAHTCQLISQSNAPVTTSNADLVTSNNEPGTEQVKFSAPANVPAVTTTTSMEGFGQPTVSLAPGIEQTISIVPSDSIPASAHCSPEAGVLPPFLLCPSFLADEPVLSQAGPAARSDVLSNNTSSNNQAMLSLPTFSDQHLLPAENSSKQPSVSHQSSLNVVSSPVIKVTSCFDLPDEPKLLSVSDADLGGQAVLVEGKLPVLQPGANHDFSTKTGESGVKASQDRVQSAPGLNLSPLSSPYKRTKNAGAKQNEGGSVSEFADPHSPAYSDISDANDNAPLLDAPMLEKEAQAATEEDAASSKVSPNNTQDSYVYSPFYGQPPYLTPAVPSADHSDCGPTLKPPLSNPILDKQQLMDRLVETAREKRLTTDSGPVRGRPNDIPPKFPGEQLLRDDKEARDKAGRVISSGQGTVRSDVLKSQQQQQQQQQQQSHKLFSGDTVLPQHMAMMPHMIMPSTYGFGTPFGFFSPEYNEHMQRMYHQHIQQQQQQQEVRRHAAALKPLAEGGDHGKTRTPLKVSTEGKHSDEKFKPTKFEGSLPTPPSLIPDRNRPEPKEESEKTDRSREKQAEGRKVTKDVVDIKNIAEIGGGAKPESFDMKMLSERPDMQRYCLQPHYLDQQQRLVDLQSTKSAMELGAGGCKPSAVVAPQTRDKCLPVGGVVGSNAAALHCAKQQKDDSQGGRSYDGHRPHRDVQKNQSMTPPQQPPQQHKSVGGSHEGSTGRTPKEPGTRPNVKDDSGASASSRCLKGKEESPMISLPISMSAGMPAPYASYYSHYLPSYAGAMPFDPSHATLPVYPGMIGYPPPTYIHPAQMLSPALAMASAEGKPCDVLPQPQPSTSFFSRDGQPHKTHEPKEVAKTQQQADRSQPSPGNRESARPKSRGGGGDHSTGKDGDHSSPPTQRHLHTHHHMHVVSPLYQYVHSDAALIASQQAAAATAATQLPRPFLAK